MANALVTITANTNIKQSLDLKLQPRRQRSIQNYLNLSDVSNDSFFMQRIKKNCAWDIFQN